jgi:hypothetical protein
MHVGFTGTQRGMTVEQMITVLKLLKELEPSVVHHGDCIGADEEFHILCSLAHIPEAIIHPPTNPDKRAWCEFLLLTFENIVIREQKDYLIRNQDIVDESGIMIATPYEAREQQRSGTWSTMRKARKAEKDLIIVWPSGVKTIGDWK